MTPGFYETRQYKLNDEKITNRKLGSGIFKI